ncbi:DUF924 family protein [Xanthobacter oligotrophicus]|uniref:DUF924 family protein n=1 Tax=Xanthobacter oligotrophicus TaxID=2607286 RepID=UPI0011F1D404|nr:DUF924 family protein [Xanthobacter oligotrophicus]MCG5235054.1 DUF924 family protein [Xanthobacter oligotrophicus]
MLKDMTPADVLVFWLAAGREKWFGGGAAFDDAVRAALLPAHEAAVAGALDTWRETPEGALAWIILMDQVPRNVFRGTPRAFATDARALAAAEQAIARGFDGAPQIAPGLHTFFYLPFTHAEDKAAQARGVELYRALGQEEGMAFALVHKEIIDRFGRFPHRNPILGRQMSAEEQAYLDGGGFSG